MAKASIPPAINAKLQQLKSSVDKTVDELASAEGSELLPSSVLEGLERNVSHRIERLERRLQASVKRRGNEVLREVAIARGALFPFGTPQERALNIVPFIARYGEELITSVEKEASIHAATLA